MQQPKKIKNNAPIRIMEVCGTHTMAIAKFGIKQLLPPNIQLISGPGCPVCVTAQEDIERALALAQNPQVIITTFGDMVRIPGRKHSLQTLQSRGAQVKIIYSPMDSLKIAKENPAKEVVFLAVGFETTAATTAYVLREAIKEGISNFSILSLHKLVIPGLQSLLTDPNIHIDGFILPGHVSSIIGSYPYQFIANQYRKACVITGFEAQDILEGIQYLLEQHSAGEANVANQYTRGVKREGNIIALSYITKYFATSSAKWRGLGTIANSGLKLRPSFASFDALEKFQLREHGFELEEKLNPCSCGEILKGQKEPRQCPLFSTACTPAHPIGPCMVSSEGSCAAAFYYHDATDSIGLL